MYRARKKVKVRPTNQTRCWNDFTHYSHPLDNWRSVHAHGNANQVRVTVEACYQKRVPIVIDILWSFWDSRLSNSSINIRPFLDPLRGRLPFA